ncbi:GNAT family N-acetyltransferase [Listeria booriae]|uniref:GNAT family N-acetyltransferase n=1 Tax=Listeria booriae TaxID=1552123 RepID=A0A842AS07_9LIST|nr:GNAT family N-acetyltransferase [Listeria booriae]MBC1292145.1 GNAT family N-acetyltransferase [Listeria booriae]MBC1401285.1 GNAT family N-acetyltransferase [Listeria booriae]MBC1616298.1 GNAT family N-acetyltransferase [Listeria booriae]MBC1649799.1 GNAT family N-acetyltransferase [Listeria booriae]MBC1944903.1 GNAT family N-acetyltransferase [Listeria booriae]
MLVETLQTLPSEFVSDNWHIRYMTAEDAEQLLEIWSDTKVTEYMNIETFDTLTQAKEIIDAIDKTETACRYVIEDTISKELIGSFGINELYLGTMTAEIGYELKRAYWRKGIMSTVLSTFIHVIYSTTPIRTLTAKVSPQNAPSSTLLIKLGFQFDELVSEFDMKSKNLEKVRQYKLDLK